MWSVLKDQESNPGQKPLFESRVPAFLGQCDVIYRRKYLYSTRTPDFRMTVVCQSQTPSNYYIIILLYYYIIILLYYYIIISLYYYIIILLYFHIIRLLDYYIIILLYYYIIRLLYYYIIILLYYYIIILL